MGYVYGTPDGASKWLGREYRMHRQAEADRSSFDGNLLLGTAVARKDGKAVADLYYAGRDGKVHKDTFAVESADDVLGRMGKDDIYVYVMAGNFFAFEDKDYGVKLFYDGTVSEDAYAKGLCDMDGLLSGKREDDRVRSAYGEYSAGRGAVRADYLRVSDRTYGMEEFLDGARGDGTDPFADGKPHRPGMLFIRNGEGYRSGFCVVDRAGGRPVKEFDARYGRRETGTVALDAVGGDRVRTMTKAEMARPIEIDDCERPLAVVAKSSNALLSFLKDNGRMMASLDSCTYDVFVRYASMSVRGINKMEAGKRKKDNTASLGI